MTTIYGLRCPLDNQIKYVGRTKNLDQRYKLHCMGSNKVNAQLYYWIHRLKKIDRKPILVTLCTCHSEEASRMESRYITEYDEIYTLFNINSGIYCH